MWFMNFGDLLNAQFSKVRKKYEKRIRSVFFRKSSKGLFKQNVSEPVNIRVIRSLFLKSYNYLIKSFSLLKTDLFNQDFYMQYFSFIKPWQVPIFCCRLSKNFSCC